MYDFYSSNSDAIIGFSVIAALVIFCFVVKHYQTKARRARIYGGRGFNRRRPSNVSASDMAIASAFGGGSDATFYENEVRRLVREARVFLRNHDWAPCDRLSRMALSRAVQTLSGDHWLLAEALCVRGRYLMERGYYVDARKHLQPAMAIISEWPDKESGDNTVGQIETCLQKCKDRLGY